MDIQPLVHVLDLSCSVEHAFDTYTQRIADWWHADYSGDPETYTGVTIDPWMRGQITERHSTGAEHDWGEVIAWDPPNRVAYTFSFGQDRAFPTVVRVGFTATEGGCQVRFEHGGWNDFNAAAQEKFTFWPFLLERYRQLAEG